MMLVKWNKVQDRHIEGLTSIGKMYIRLDQEDNVTAMYTVFSSSIKYLPDVENITTVEAAKHFLEQKVNY